MRAGVAFALPLLASYALGWQKDGVFVAMAAQAIALPDLRGAYGMRMVILAVTTLIAAGSAMLGVCTGGSLWSSILAMGFLALLGGFWRHLSADYGPGISVSSALLFLLGLAHPGSASSAWHLGGLILLGGMATTLLSMCLWPFRPQHPFRYAVAEAWVSVSDLAEKMRSGLTADGASLTQSISQAEHDLRATLDRSYVILSAAQARRPSMFLKDLEKVRVQAVQFAMRLTTLNLACERLLGRERFLQCIPVVDSCLKSLGDAARSIAITLITHRAENLSLTKVRLHRAHDLLKVLHSQAEEESSDHDGSHLLASIGDLSASFDMVIESLRTVVDERSSGMNFPRMPPDIGGHSMRSLASWLNPSPALDAMLVRYSLRMAVLTMVAVGCYKVFQIPNGYWIAFTIVVVLQPDYGSTRKRALERIGGTLAGTLLGSLLLLFPMPVLALNGCAIVMAVVFAYFLKRNYGAAVFFVTIMLVLITETMNPVHLDFTAMRLLSNLVGGIVALGAAVLFWPLREDQRFLSFLASALRTNADYVQTIARFLQGEDADMLMAKRRAENAGRLLSDSLQRLLAEPGRADEGEASLATYSHRITRALTTMTSQVSRDTDPKIEPYSKTLELVMQEMQQSLNDMASRIENEFNDPGRNFTLEELSEKLSEAQAKSVCCSMNTQLTVACLAKCVAEVRAMAFNFREVQGLLSRSSDS